MARKRKRSRKASNPELRLPGSQVSAKEARRRKIKRRHKASKRR